MSMHRLEDFLSVLEYSLSKKSKRHILGGILFSIALLFGGLAFTVMTLKVEESNEQQLVV